MPPAALAVAVAVQVPKQLLAVKVTVGVIVLPGATLTVAVTGAQAVASLTVKV